MGMTFEQWFTQLNPATASISTLVFMLFTFGFLFIWKLGWPWFTKDYWPQRAKLKETLALAKIQIEKDETSIQGTMRDALIELKVIAAQNLLSLQQHETQIAQILNQQTSFYAYIDNARMQTINDVRAALSGNLEKKD
jgi:hypothetical protein